MTAPVTGFSINITDAGTATFQAADWSAEGHLWAIPTREIPLADVRRIAAILGPEALAGFDARVVATRKRLADRVATEQQALLRVQQAQAALERFDAAVSRETPQGEGVIG